jgi:hypothetical protein
MLCNPVLIERLSESRHKMRVRRPFDCSRISWSIPNGRGFCHFWSQLSSPPLLQVDLPSDDSDCRRLYVSGHLYQFSSRTGIFRGHATRSGVGRMAARCCGAARRIALDQRKCSPSCANRAGSRRAVRPGARHKPALPPRRASRRLVCWRDERLRNHSGRAATLARAYDPAMPGPA